MATILTPSDRKLEVLSEAAGDLKMQYLWPDDPYVHMTEVPPGYEIALHSHSETEVTVILTGSARVGEQLCGAGTVLIIEADEKYGLVAEGDEPLTFLVVRPRKAKYTRST